ncbi:hypothetical protein J3F84DRAFT_401448 [Trichoderma pleuroticola]
MDSSMEADLELRLKGKEPAKDTDPAVTLEASGPSGSANASESSKPAEPAESSALEAAKADRAARNAAFRKDIAANSKELKELAEKISKMKRSPSPPAPPPLRKKRSHTELLCQLIISRMKTQQYSPAEIVQLLIGKEEGEASLRPRNESIYDMGSSLGQGKGCDRNKTKGKEKEKEKDVTEVICPGGDILLGIEGSNTAFRVYSQNLMCASSSFEELVEGIMIASGDDERILVLDPENVDIVRLICRILHLQNHLVPQSLTPWMLLDTAIMVNKYGLQRAVVLASRQWLLSGRDTREFMGDPTLASGCYMAAAALFFDEFMFDKCIWELISICTVPFERLWAWPALKEQVSDKGIKLLTLMRDKARVRVYQTLLSETGLRCYAGWDRTFQERYERILARYKPATTVRLPLAQVILEVKKALFRELGGPNSPMDCL